MNVNDRSAFIAQANLFAEKALDNDTMTVFQAHAMRCLGEVIATAAGAVHHEYPFVEGGPMIYEFEFGNVDHWLNIMFIPQSRSNEFVVSARVGTGPETEVGAHSEFTARSADTIRLAVERGFAALNADLAAA